MDGDVMSHLDLNSSFYDPVKLRADNEAQKIDAAVVARVLAIAGGYLAELIEAGQAILAYQIVNAWLQHHVECVRQDSVTGNPV